MISNNQLDSQYWMLQYLHHRVNATSATAVGSSPKCFSHSYNGVYLFTKFVFFQLQYFKYYYLLPYIYMQLGESWIKKKSRCFCCYIRFEVPRVQKVVLGMMSVCRMYRREWTFIKFGVGAQLETLYHWYKFLGSYKKTQIHSFIRNRLKLFWWSIVLEEQNVTMVVFNNNNNYKNNKNIKTNFIFQS